MSKKVQLVKYTSNRTSVVETIYERAREELLDQVYFFLSSEVIPMTPVDSEEVNEKYGTVEELRTNAKVVITKDSKLQTDVYVHFGSDKVSKDYAVLQHENMVYKHTYPTDSKFLEFPFEQNYDNIVQAVGGAIRSL